MKLLIAGGSGFGGSHFIKYTLEHHPKDDIVSLDIVPFDYDILEGIDHKRLKEINCDVCDKTAVFKIFEEEKIDCVLNYASAYARGQEFSPFVDVNVVGTAVLLDAASKYHIERFHQISSGEVYGLLPLGREMYYSEKSALKPAEQYAASKAAADMIAMSYFDTFKTPVTISRCVNLYGPFQKEPKQIPSLIKQALHDEELPIYGAGAEVRDWVHVDDYNRAVDLILRKGEAGEVYNIGSHSEIRSIYLVRIILNELNKSEDMISYRENRRGQERRNALDYSKIQEELGWEPQIEFAQGMKETIAWHMKHDK